MTYVLFVCNHNAGRSQMAQAFFERFAPQGAEAESAGTNPGEHVWPEVVEVRHHQHEPRRRLALPRWQPTPWCGDLPIRTAKSIVTI